MMYATYRNSQLNSDGNNTKRATKRRKVSKPPGRSKNQDADAVKQIARKGTDCIVADEATEKRLKTYGPPTGRQYGGDQFIW